MAWTGFSNSGSQWGLSEDETTSLRHYLLYRGLSNTARAFEIELKQDKEKAFRVDKIMEQILHHVTAYDIVGLKEYWNFLETKIFSCLDDKLSENVPKLQKGLLRYYVAHACQLGKSDKVVEFFDKMSSELSAHAEWKEWFMIPFLKMPESYNAFEIYFNKQWQDTLLLSLHNFLCLVLSNMRRPAILSFEEDRKRIEALELENATFKKRIEELIQKTQSNASTTNEGSLTEKTLACGWDVAPPNDLFSTNNLEMLDDFHNLNIHKTKQASVSASPVRVATSTTTKPSTSNSVSSTSNNTSAPTLPTISSLSSFFKSITGNNVTGNLAKKNVQHNTRSLQSQSMEVPCAEDTVLIGDNITEFEVPSSSPCSNKVSNCENFVTNTTTSVVTFTSESQSVDKKGWSAASPSQNAFLEQSEFHDAKISRSSYAVLSQDVYAEHGASIVTCRFSSSGKSVVSLDVDGILKIWSCLPTPKTISGTVSKSVLTTLEWLPASERHLLLGSKAGDIRLFDAKERKVIKDAHVDGNFPKLNCISVHPEGTSFVTSSHGRVVSSSSVNRINQFHVGMLTLWDLNSDIKQKRYLPLSPGPVAINCMTYNGSGNLLLTGGADGRIRLYDIRVQDSIASWLGHNSDISTVSFASNSNTCFSFSADGTLAQWSLDKTSHKIVQYDFSEPSSKISRIGDGKSFILNSACSHVLIGWGNTVSIYKFGAEFNSSKHILPGKDNGSPVTCVDWLETKLANICLTGTQKGTIIVTFMDTRAS